MMRWRLEGKTLFHGCQNLAFIRLRSFDIERGENRFLTIQMKQSDLSASWGHLFAYGFHVVNCYKCDQNQITFTTSMLIVGYVNGTILSNSPLSFVNESFK